MKTRNLAIIFFLFLFYFIKPINAATYIGLKTGLGVSSTPISGAGENEIDLSASFGFSFGFDGYWYFSKAGGLHFSVNYNLLHGQARNKVENEDYLSQFHTISIDVGPGFRFGNFLIDFDLLFNFKISYRIKEEGIWKDYSEIESTSDIDKRKFVLGVGFSFGYRFKTSKLLIPLCLGFKYYLTNFVRDVGEKGTHVKAWSLLLTVGVLFDF